MKKIINLSIVVALILNSCSSDDDSTTLRVCGSSIPVSNYENINISLWKGGVIPYKFDSNFPVSRRYEVRWAMSQWVNKTKRLHFREKTSRDNKYLLIRNGSGCNSELGERSPTVMTLSDNCTPASILHELGHVLGFIHTHQLITRDSFLNMEGDSYALVRDNLGVAQANDIVSQIYNKEQVWYTNNSELRYSSDLIGNTNSIMMYGSKLQIKNHTQSPIRTLLIQRNKNLFFDKQCNPIVRSTGLHDSDIKNIQKLYPKSFVLVNQSTTMFHNVKVVLRNRGNVVYSLAPGNHIILTYNPNDDAYYHSGDVVEYIDLNGGSWSDDINFWGGPYLDDKYITYTSSYFNHTIISENYKEGYYDLRLFNAIDRDGIDGSGPMRIEMSVGAFSNQSFHSPYSIICRITNY